MEGLIFWSLEKRKHNVGGSSLTLVKVYFASMPGKERYIAEEMDTKRQLISQRVIEVTWNLSVGGLTLMMDLY